MNIDIPMQVRLRGRYRIQVRKGCSGQVHTDTGWFDNLITNQGMDEFGKASFNYNVPGPSTCVGSRCGVGTGTATPAFTDTVLSAPLAITPDPATATGISSDQFSQSYVSSTPNYISSVYTYIFPLGSVVGNISEVGVGGVTAYTDTTPQLFSHALIVDGGGTPTTISVTSADQLEVTFELRHYLDLTDTAYSITISGTAYSGNIRRANSTFTAGYSIVCQVDKKIVGNPSSVQLTLYNGSIGAVTTLPSGSATTPIAGTAGTYSAGTYFNSFSYYYGTSAGNLSGGITAMSISCNMGVWQLSVSPPLLKDNTKTMTLSFNISWARYP